MSTLAKLTMFCAPCLVLSAGALAQTTYKCPGRPVTYTNAVSAEEARKRGCTPVTSQGQAEPAARAPAQRGAPLGADVDGWSLVSRSRTAEYWFKNGSLQVSQTPKGVRFASLLGKIISTPQRMVVLDQWYVPLADCKTGIGKIVNTQLDGAYKAHYEFILGDTSVQSVNAQAICEGYRLSVGK